MERSSALRIWTVGLAATACAVGANLIILFAGKRVLDIPEAFTPTSVGPVVFFTTVGLVGATAVFHGLNRWTSRPMVLFRRIAFVVLALSFIPDFLILRPGVMPGMTVPAVLLLMTMHVVAAAIVLVAFTRARAEQPTATATPG